MLNYCGEGRALPAGVALEATPHSCREVAGGVLVATAEAEIELIRGRPSVVAK
jgi:hypothetical protein